MGREEILKFLLLEKKMANKKLDKIKQDYHQLRKKKKEMTIKMLIKLPVEEK